MFDDRELEFVRAILGLGCEWRQLVKEFQEEEQSAKASLSLTRELLKDHELFKGSEMEKQYIEQVVEIAQAESGGAAVFADGKIEITTQLGTKIEVRS